MSLKVSVIIPCFNSLKFLPETIASVESQTYTNIEIIVIDDGSTDGSLDYLQSLEISNLVVKYNNGKGACAARNYGLEFASGDYIQFLDADDLLSPDKIKKQVALLKEQPHRVSVCSTVHFYENIANGIITDTPFLSSTNQPQDFLLKLYGSDGKTFNMVQTSAWLTPRAIIEKAGVWDETLLKDQDGEFFCRVLMASQGICYVPDVFNYYRKHISKNSISSGKSEKHLQSQVKALQSKEHALNDFKDTKAYRNAMGLQYKFIAIDAYPQFKEISQMALQKVKYYGGSNYEPVLGGKIIELVKFLFGWRVAKQFSYWVHTNKVIKSLRV